MIHFFKKKKKKKKKKFSNIFKYIFIITSYLYETICNINFIIITYL